MKMQRNAGGCACFILCIHIFFHTCGTKEVSLLAVKRTVFRFAIEGNIFFINVIFAKRSVCLVYEVKQQKRKNFPVFWTKSFKILTYGKGNLFVVS